MNMGKLRKGPSKKQEEAAGDDVGAGDNELGEADDFDNFLETLDDSSDSDEEGDEGDPAEEEDDSAEDTSGDEDDDEEDDEMEPEEQEMNEDGDESEEGGDSDEQDDNDTDEDVEEGEEGIPIQNGIGGEEEAGDGSSEDEEPAGKKKMSAKSHKMDLKKLQETDPEFFTFLKENDAELLDFNDSDDDSESDEEESVHKPPETLEEASDSEAEEERMDETSEDHKSKVEKNLKKGVVDINVISHWQTKLSTTRDITVFANTVEALKCAVSALSEAEPDTTLKWKVDGSANFNALIRLCIKEMKGFCVRFLCGNNNVTLSENTFDSKPFETKDKSKQKWTKLRPKLKSYMEILVQLLKCLGNPDAITSILRHCQRMCGFWAILGIKSLKMLRCLINVWSTGEDSCRVLAFLTIIRITNYNKDLFLLPMFKQMYMSYVANCKFTSVNTWPAINFMRSSLVELYLLDTNLAYSVAFPFIRQLAIHLRNALSPSSLMNSNEGRQKSSEAHRVVYSWQFLHSLHLWVDVLATHGGSQDNRGEDNLKLLIYPVVQICMGTIKLIPTRKYIPIRFHIIRMLIKIQEKAGVFIPVLPHITEVLRLTDFSNKNAAFKFSVRPLDLTCCLRSDPAETGYLKAVAENAFECMLLYLKGIGTDLAFPEIVTPTVMFMKTFLKKDCKNIEVYKKFKTLIEKVEANSKYISEKRNKALEEGIVTLADKKSHKILQVQMQTSKPHPPIFAYAAEYFKTNQKAQLKSQKSPIETKEERLIPKLADMKKKKGNASKTEDFDEPMFKSDESDEEFATKLDNPQTKKRKVQKEDSDEEEPSKKIKKKKKKVQKKQKASSVQVDDNGVQDELVDFELSD